MEQMTVNGSAFTALRLLGKGKGGYSWLVTDGKAHFTLKQLHHEPCDYYQFGDKLASELQDYETLRRVGIKLPQLLAVDTENERILKEYIEGPTVLSLVLQDALPETALSQLRAMCALLYPAGLNIDYFPTNFILQQGTLYYIDYECNAYMQQWDFEHWGCNYWAKTPQLAEYIEKNPHSQQFVDCAAAKALVKSDAKR